MIEYAVEELTPSLIKEMEAVQGEYWEECAGPFHPFPPDVDWRTYMLAQKTGQLKVIVGRAKGILKAGVFDVITPDPHCACIAAGLSLLFVHPQYRKGWEGLRLIALAEEEARKSGAQLLMTHGGMHNGVDRLFEYLKYKDAGRYFVKVIGDTTAIFKER